MIAILRKLLATRITCHLPATDVVLRSRGAELSLDLNPGPGGKAHVALAGSLTQATADMMARWFVPLRATNLAIELNVEKVTRIDRPALQVILRIARSCAVSDVAFRITTGDGRWRDRLRPLAPAGLLTTNHDQTSDEVVPAPTLTLGVMRGNDRPSSQAATS